MPIIGAPPPPPPPSPTRPPGTRINPVTADLGPIRWGYVDDAGVEWHMADLDGWWDSPDTVGVVTQRPAGPGAFLGPAYDGPRAITLTGWIIAPDTQRRDQAVRDLKGVLPLTPTAVFRVDEQPHSTLTFVRRSSRVKVDMRGRTAAYVQVPMLAPDPRCYGTAPVTLTAPVLLAPGAGLTLPVTCPVSLPASPGGGSLTVTNPGNRPCPWQARIVGRVSLPRLSVAGTNQRFGVDIPLAEGEYVDVDSRAGTVTFNGSQSVSGLIAYGTDWFELPRGTSTVVFTGTDPSPGASLFFTPLPCWS